MRLIINYCGDTPQTSALRMRKEGRKPTPSMDTQMMATKTKTQETYQHTMRQSTGIKRRDNAQNMCTNNPEQTNKNLRCGNRKGLLGRNDQTHHRMGPKTMESIPPSKRNTQADIQLRTRQTNHQQETDGCIQIKHNPEHQPSRMSSKSTAYVPPKTASTPTKANTQTCSYLDFNQFLIRRITRNICLRLRIKQIQILTCREQDIR